MKLGDLFVVKDVNFSFFLGDGYASAAHSVLFRYTGCVKIREFQIQSVVHFSSPKMEIKKNGTPSKDTLV
jgi:hypothetical protein